MLEQDTTKRGWVNKILLERKKDLKFEVRDNKKNEVEAIINSAMYGQQVNSNQMPGFYYLVLWKGYPKEENTWEPS